MNFILLRVRDIVFENSFSPSFSPSLTGLYNLSSGFQDYCSLNCEQLSTKCSAPSTNPLALNSVVRVRRGLSRKSCGEWPGRQLFTGWGWDSTRELTETEALSRSRDKRAVADLTSGAESHLLQIVRAQPALSAIHQTFSTERDIKCVGIR